MSPPSPAKPSPLPRSAQYPHRSSCLQRRETRPRKGPRAWPPRRFREGTRLACPGLQPVASPRKARAPQAWPRRDSWIVGTASCSMRGLRTGPGGDTRRLPRPVSPRAALAAWTPGSGLSTEPPAPGPHPERTHKAPSGPRCTAPRPRPTLRDTGPQVPAPAPGRPPTLQKTLMQLLHGHQRPHAGATQSQAARPRVRAPLALCPCPRPDPCPLGPHASRRPRPGPCPRAGHPAHLGARGHSGARRPALRLRGPEARAPMGVRRDGRPGGKKGGPRRPLLGPRQGSQLPWPLPRPPLPGSTSGLSEPRRERGRHRGARSQRRA